MLDSAAKKPRSPRASLAKLAKDPTSRATESSRSNVIAMEHTVKQMYGEAAALDVANPITANLGCQT